MTSSVVSRVVGLGVLTAAGQLIVIGTLPTYSRFFDPAAYGEYVIFVGVFTVVSVLAGVRYDSAIVVPRKDAVAAALSLLVMAIALSVSTVIAGATLLTALPLPGFDHGLPIDPNFGYGLAIATAVGALQRCLAAWCVRDSRFLLMGWGQLAFCIVTVAAQLSFSTFMHQLPALIWGFVCALGCQVLCLGGPWLRTPCAARAPARLLRALPCVARKYRRFPTYMVGYALASSARDRLIQMVLGIGAGAAAVGRFGLAYRVVFAPNSLIYSAVSPVFYGIASRGKQDSVGRFAAGLVETVFVMLVVPYVAFAVEAPALTDGILSEKWHGTGPYLQALAGPALLLAATCWLDRAFDSYRRQNVAFALEASFTLFSVALVGGLARFLDPVAVTWVFSALALIYYFVYFLVTFLACGFPMQQFRRGIRTGLLVTCAVLSGALATHRLPALPMRIALYALLMTCVLAVWFKWLGGTATIQGLLRSRVGHG